MIQQVKSPLKMARRISGNTAARAAEKLYMSERNVFHVESKGNLTPETAAMMSQVYGMLIHKPTCLASASAYLDVTFDQTEQARRDYRTASINNVIDDDEIDLIENALRKFGQAATALWYAIELTLSELAKARKKAPARRQPQQEQEK